MNKMLAEIKTALRVRHNVLDDEISDLIEAARQDLSLSGVSAIKVRDNDDALIKRAVITYVKANFLSDAKEAERFQSSYNLLKNHLRLAGDYTE